MVSLTGDDKQYSRTGDMKKWLAKCEFFSCATIRLRYLSCGTHVVAGRWLAFRGNHRIPQYASKRVPVDRQMRSAAIS
jgi:hypothetical protein